MSETTNIPSEVPFAAALGGQAPQALSIDTAMSKSNTTTPEMPSTPTGDRATKPLKAPPMSPLTPTMSSGTIGDMESQMALDLPQPSKSIFFLVAPVIMNSKSTFLSMVELAFHNPLVV